jgi:serralysin
LYGPSTQLQANDTFVLRSDVTNMIWDGGGIDTVDGSSQSKPISLFLEPGYWGSIGDKSSFISSAGQITIDFGSVIEKAIGGSGDDYLTGNLVDNVLFGGLGRDTLKGMGGNDTIDGGVGIDTAVYSHKKIDYTISKLDAGYMVSDKLGVEGVDAVVNTERLQFSDLSVAFDIDGIAGQCYRLYQSTFNRIPDLAGLGYWIAGMDSGDSLVSVANNFVIIAGFDVSHGSSMTDSAFLTNLYQNIYHRAPDLDGFNYWLNELANGSQTRATVLIGFSENIGNQLQVIGRIADGIEYLPYLLHV